MDKVWDPGIVHEFPAPRPRNPFPGLRILLYTCVHPHFVRPKVGPRKRMNAQRARALLCAAAMAMVAASPAVSQSAKSVANSPDVVEVRQYRLTMEKLDKLVAATDALNKLIASDPAFRKKMDANTEEDRSIDQKARRLDAEFPQAAAVLQANGLSTREYIVLSLAFINDVTFVGMKKQGAIKEYPANALTPENAAFVEQNFDKMQELSKKLMPPDDATQ